MPWARVDQARAGQLGAAEGGPYDRILVSAEPPELPEELVGQLAEGGRMVIPVHGEMLVVDRLGAEARVRRLGAFRFVPLVRDRPADAGPAG